MKICAFAFVQNVCERALDTGTERNERNQDMYKLTLSLAALNWCVWGGFRFLNSKHSRAARVYTRALPRRGRDRYIYIYIYEAGAGGLVTGSLSGLLSF